MLLIPRPFLSLILGAACEAFPRECCGLLAGRDHGEDNLVVTRVEPSPNQTSGKAEDSFEIDPQVRFDLMRAIDGTNKRIIGHYHSHPNGLATPSATDLEKAYEPDLIWVIVGMQRGGQAKEVRAFAVDENRQGFHDIGLQTTDEATMTDE